MNIYNNEFESADKINRPGFGEFANTPSGIHLQKPTEEQKKSRENKKMSMKDALKIFSEVSNEIDNDSEINKELSHLKSDLNKIKNSMESNLELLYEKITMIDIIMERTYMSNKETQIPEKKEKTIAEKIKERKDAEELLAERERAEASQEKLKSKGNIHSEPIKKDEYNSNPWRKIKYGMGHSEIREILGEPLKIQSMRGKERWSYINQTDILYPLGRGDLEFYHSRVREPLKFNPGVFQSYTYKDEVKLESWVEP